MRPLAHNLLKQLESPVAVRLDQSSFWGWGFNVFQVQADLTLEEIAKWYAPAYETTAPDAHTERVQYFDHVHRTVVQVANGVPPLTVEVVRVSVPSEAVAVVETIATWLRAIIVSPAGNSVTELYDGVISPPTIANGSPFPYPLNHPEGGTLTVEWLLVRERVSDAGVTPAMAGPGPQTIIPPDTALTVPWRDQRYNWNGNHAVGHYIVTGDRSYLRLFATFITTGQEGRWIVEIAGRLGGFFQLTGYKRAGLAAALQRS